MSVGRFAVIFMRLPAPQGVIITLYLMTKPRRESELYLFFAQVFPLDYILITVITVYFVLTSMAGIRNMGIWFFWIRVQSDRTHQAHSSLNIRIVFFFHYF